jgi:hypothetical protein
VRSQTLGRLAKAATIGPLPRSASLTQWRQGAQRSLRRHDRGLRAGRVAAHPLTLCFVLPADRDPMPHTSGRSGGGWEVTRRSQLRPRLGLVHHRQTSPDPTHRRPVRLGARCIRHGPLRSRGMGPPEPGSGMAPTGCGSVGTGGTGGTGGGKAGWSHASDATGQEEPPRGLQRYN